ncbi:hypothetical protein CAEBREN_15987 [Caenorhabditis brenneri]|uniref:F-box associated domain-containing protein n=1 Tax=Caenorhabditis brenneri TaxID=135651 RepID=G0MMP5_CAEBE|nr:hypothetical protein CAEBREN_15987 [Caenorhabditis brenneri]
MPTILGRALDYQSQLKVLQWMSPVKRYDMRAAGMTVLDTANNKAPLYFDFIEIQRNQVILHDVRTTWEVLGRLPDGKPFQFPGLQPGRGAPYDVDQYGRREEDPHLEQGDISIEDPVMANEEVLPIPESPVDGVEFYLKRTTKNHRTGKVDVAISKPGMKIRDALRLYVDRVVGTLDRSVFVERFSVQNTRIIFRLPVGLKLHIEELCYQANGNNLINGLLPIFTHPIKYMFLQVRHMDDQVFQNPTFRNCPRVFVCLPANQMWWSGVLRELEIPELVLFRSELIPRDLTTLASFWMEDHKRIGTTVSCLTRNVEAYLQDFAELPGVYKTVNPRSNSPYGFALTVKIDFASVICIYGAHAYCSVKRLLNQWDCEMIVIEVMDIQKVERLE